MRGDRSEQRKRQADSCRLCRTRKLTTGNLLRGDESLFVPFYPTPYRTATLWHGPGQALRFHVGLEAVEDLINDLAAGFERMKSA